jgi:hypothetical protein
MMPSFTLKLHRAPALDEAEAEAYRSKKRLFQHFTSIFKASLTVQGDAKAGTLQYASQILEDLQKVCGASPLTSILRELSLQ